MSNNNLVDLLTRQADLNKDQAIQTLYIITSYAKEKYPILRGTIDIFLRDELATITSPSSKEALFQ
jgi:hypothetical protein